MVAVARPVSPDKAFPTPMPPRLKQIQAKLGVLGLAFCVLLLLYLPLNRWAPASGITVLAGFLLFVTGALWALRIVRRSVRRAIWRLRNRLIVAYLFIAFVPVVLIMSLVALGAYTLAGQAAVYLVESELERRTAALNATAQLIADAPEPRRAPLTPQLAAYIQSRMPGVEILVRDGGEYRYPEKAGISAPPPVWKDANGIVLKDSRFYTWAHAGKSGADVTLMVPLSSDFLADLVPNLGEVFLSTLSEVNGAAPAKQRPVRRPAEPDARRRANRVPPPDSRFDVDVTWLTPITTAAWDSPAHTETAVLFVHTRPSAILGTIFRAEVSQFILLLFTLVAGALLVVEIVSLVTGITLSRTITRAVHNLYQGTQHVKDGDFSHRIEVEGNDQLAELGRSFNGMTENLERLIVVEKEQERLKSEIAIAREVQTQLFPRGAPAMKTIELTGVCHPARMVSGDYYDFVRVQDSVVAVAIGDVAGKGISAALLMAALQSIMRTQLTVETAVAAHASPGGGANGAHVPLSTADLVSQLNKQVYANTSPEKYATFCFGLYDDQTRTLSYTNAGHLPPIVLRDGHAEQLDVTGTVVGAFPFSRYEQKSVTLRPGDLLVAFTDGIIEPENEYGEQFGEEQLIELLLRYRQRDSKEIIARVMESVEQWTGSSELYDDMTLLVARGV